MGIVSSAQPQCLVPQTPGIHNMRSRFGQSEEQEVGGIWPEVGGKALPITGHLLLFL